MSREALVCRFRAGSGATEVGVLTADGAVHAMAGVRTVADALRAVTRGDERLGPAVSNAELLAPLDHQEVWGAGVAYLRSKEAREDEARSTGASVFYDRVYDSQRPELFFKATPSRVVGPGQPIRVRADSSWSVPEPEIALWLDANLDLLGIGLGNDVTARDVERENPLYLTQAKVYASGCALGPAVWPQRHFGAVAEIEIELSIRRGGASIYEGALSGSALHRPLEDLVAYLVRDNTFPNGVVLLIGTGIVPPDEIALRHGDEVEISAARLGSLVNPVQVEDARVGA